MKLDIQQVKLRYKLVGRSEKLDRAIETAILVAPTDLSVLITGESGVGKEIFPRIIHDNSARKHGKYFAVNCGAIPEGTIDSELFGHKKGSFTSAHEDRKGYFEVADGGTLFLDEVGELPLSTQARLLRVLESGEFIRVGSSEVQKTNVRIVAATNVDMQQAIYHGRFREDLFYRLNSVPINIPSLRDRGDDALLLFRKFASDFSEKYRVPTIVLTDTAQQMLLKHSLPGNVRQLKNIAEQISVMETCREITPTILHNYLPEDHLSQLPILFGGEPVGKGKSFNSEREILYQILFDMRQDVNDLKRLVHELSGGEKRGTSTPSTEVRSAAVYSTFPLGEQHARKTYDEATEVVEPLTLEETEEQTIRKALEKHRGRRNRAAQELGISERTLYRRIKELKIDD